MVAIGAVVVVVNAFMLFDRGPRWSEALRWFLAGFCLALWVAGMAQRAMRVARGDVERAEIDRMATEMASAIEREMRARGFVGEVDIGFVSPKERGETRH